MPWSPEHSLFSNFNFVFHVNGVCVYGKKGTDFGRRQPQMAACRPYCFVLFLGFNFCVALNVNSKLQ